MAKLFASITLMTLTFTSYLFAQDTLPKISVKNINKQVIVSWKNNYGAKISYINIQRSKDSLKNFRTIGSVLNPLNKENGFVDSKVDTINYYRVFVAFSGGTYFFSRSKKPAMDTIQAKAIVQIETPSIVPVIELPPPQPLPLPPAPLPTKPARSNAIEKEEDLIPARKFHPKPAPVGFVPNKFIFTDKDNNLIISLPDAEKENFSIRFFDHKNHLILEIKKVMESYMIAEKVNFIHTGWFYYQLYNDGIFLEKYKFYIGKEGRGGQPPPEIKNNSDSIK